MGRLSPQAAAARLRELADQLDTLELASGNVSANVYVMDITDRESLRKVVALIDDPVCRSGDASQWVGSRNYRQDIALSVHYQAGLLGKARKKTVVIKEDKPDLSALMAGA